MTAQHNIAYETYLFTLHCNVHARGVSSEHTDTHYIALNIPLILLFPHIFTLAPTLSLLHFLPFMHTHTHKYIDCPLRCQQLSGFAV